MEEQQIDSQENQEQPQQNSPQEPKKGFDKKTWGLVVLAAVVVVLLIVVLTGSKGDDTSTPPDTSPPAGNNGGGSLPLGGTVNNQDPTDPTANWKTYRNEEFGFEFQYPQSVALNSNSDFGSETAITNNSSSVQAQYTEKKGVIFSVRVSGISSLTTDNIKNQFGATDKDNITLVATKISGADGYKVLFQDVSGVVSDFYFIEKSGQNLELTVLKDDINASNILSTFRFIE